MTAAGRNIIYQPLFVDLRHPKESWQSTDSICIRSTRPISTVADVLSELQGSVLVPNKRDFFLLVKVGDEWVEEQNISALPEGDIVVKLVSLQYIGEIKGPWGSDQYVGSLPHPSRPPCTCCRCM